MDITSPDTRDKEATIAKKAPTKKTRGRKRKIPGFVKLLIVLVMLGCTGGGIYFWWLQSTSAAAAQRSASIVLPVSKGDLNVTVQSNGQVQATREESVNYETTSDIVELLVKSGDTVEAGQPLVRQTDADQKAAMNQAQAALDTANAKLDDLKKGPTEAELASAQADVASAQATLDALLAGSSKKEIADAQADLRSARANLTKVKAGGYSQGTGRRPNRPQGTIYRSLN